MSTTDIGNYRHSTPFDQLLVEADQPTDWLIEGVIPEQSLVLLHGKEWSGKSYVAVDIAVKLALGLDWHGHSISRPRRVLFVLSEGRKYHARRIASSARWYASQSPEARQNFRENGLTIFRYEEAIFIDPKAKGDALKAMAYLAAEVERLQIDVVIFDVFADFTPDIDENSRSMGHAMKMLSPDRLPGRPTVILVHHEGHNHKGRARGHSSMQAAADVRIAVDIVGQDDPDVPTRSVIRLRNKKQKEEQPFRPFALVLEKPDLSLNAPVITGTTTLSGRSQSEPSPSPLTDNQLRILQSVRIQSELDTVTQMDVRNDTGIPRSTVSSAVKALRDKGFLEDSDGPLILTTKGLAAAGPNQSEVSPNRVSDDAGTSPNPSNPLRGDGRSDPDTDSESDWLSEENQVALKGLLAAVAK